MRHSLVTLPLWIALMLFNLNARSNNVVTFSNQNKISRVASVHILEDKTGILSLPKVIQSNQFQKVNGIPNLGVSSSSFWIKFQLHNNTRTNILTLYLEEPTMDEVDLYILYKNGKHTYQRISEKDAFSERTYNDPNYIFDICLPQGEIVTCLIKVKSTEQMMVPLSVGTKDEVQHIIADNNLIFGTYCGIILVMFLYNLFVFFTVRDTSYLYYITYLLLIGLAQIALKGYTFKYLWPNKFWLNEYGIVIFSSLAAIAGMLFVRSFLLSAKFTPVLNKGLDIINAIFILAIVLSLAGTGQVSFKIMQLNTLLCSIYALFIGYKIALRGYRPAKFFTIAWSILFGGAIIFVLKDFGIIPFNRYTSYALQIASAVEAILLSLALADRINLLKKENEQSQQQIIEHLKEKEKHLRASQEAELIVERLKKETLLFQFESLKNQVNPHFLFNSLNVLTELIHLNKDKAARFVEELSDVYRYVLESKNKEVVDVKSELKFIEAFFYLLKIRFSDNISLTVNVRNPQTTMIPPLTLQLLIENAVKHNIISEQQPLPITIYEDENGYLVIGNALQKKTGAKKSSGIGLKNIESRYSFLTDKKVIISETVDSFTVYIPLLKFES